MDKHKGDARLGGRAALAIAFAAALALGWGQDAQAGLKTTSSGGYSKPSSSSGSSLGWSRKSELPQKSSNLWDKPAAPAASSGGYQKPQGSASGSAPQQATQQTSGGYQKPQGFGSGAAAQQSAQQSSGGYQKPQAAGASGPARPTGSALDSSISRQQSQKALESYKAEQTKFAAKPAASFADNSTYRSSPAYRAGAARYQDYGSYYHARDSYYSSIGWHPPIYVYHAAPSYGMWNALTLWMMLDTINQANHAAMFYHNYQDPGFAAWRRDAEVQARDNAELRAKLDALDAQVAAMKAQGVKPEPGFIPQDVPASVAVAAEAAVKTDQRLPIRIGTGGVAGNYWVFCEGDGGSVHGLKASAELEVECAKTNGSLDNIQGVADGTLDAALVQSNVLAAWRESHPGQSIDAETARLYREFVQVLSNRKSGVSSLKDLDPAKNTVYLAGSGAESVWADLAKVDPKVGAFAAKGRVVPVGADISSIEALSGNPGAVLVFVSGLKSPLLEAANSRYADSVHMVVADEPKATTLQDAAGIQVYEMTTIPGNAYPKIQDSHMFGLSKSVKSLSVQAVFVLSKDWAAQHGADSVGKVEASVWKALPEIEAKVGVGG